MASLFPCMGKRTDQKSELYPVPYLQRRSKPEQSKFMETLRAVSESDQVTFYD